MDKEITKEINQKLKSLEKNRSDYLTTWKEITKIMAPDLHAWEKGEKAKINKKIYDPIAISSISTFVDGFLGYTASQATWWFKLLMDGVDKPPRALKHWLQQTEKQFYKILRKSLFYDAYKKLIKESGLLGIGAMYVQEDMQDKRVIFETVHIRELYVEENAKGIIDTVFRKFTMSARDIIDYWKDLPEKFKEESKDNPYATHTVIHAVYPRKARDLTKKDKKNKRYVSAWMLEQDEHLLEESGVDIMPYHIWRWQKLPGEPYGWGLGHDTLADVLTAQQERKSIMQLAERISSPPMNVPASMIGKIDLRPNGMNPYTDPNMIASPINTGGNYPITKDEIETLRSSIKQNFHVDTFLMLSQMQDKARTATEIMELMGEKAAVLGAYATGVNSEFFNPLFEHLFDIAMKNGWLPQIPMEAMRYVGSELKVDYIGPLAQTQQRFYSMQTIDKTLARILPLAEFNPEVIDNLDWDVLVERIVNDGGFPIDALKDKQLVQQIRQQRAQMQQQQLQAETADKAAGALEKTAKANQAGGLGNFFQRAVNGES